MYNRYEAQDHIVKHNYATNESTILGFPKDLFLVWVPEIAVYTEEELSTYGIPMEGDIKDPSNMVPGNIRKMTLVKWDLDRMVDAFIAGYRIAFENRSDIVVLNDLIDNYFEEVNNMLRGVNQIKVDPRLEALDKFNESIYNNNKGKINSYRQDIIRRASLQSMAPGIIFQEINFIPHDAMEGYKRVVNIENNSNVVNRFTSLTTNVVKDGKEVNPYEAINPLAPVYSQEPVIDFSKKYESKFVDPRERRLRDSYNRVKNSIYK